MLKKYFFIILIIVSFTCKDSKQNAFLIPYSEKDIKVDGIIEEVEWYHGVLIDGLISPWNHNSFDKTEFYASFSDYYFNFAFNVIDSTFITFPFENEMTVIKEDRVELFFSNDKSLNTYHCIEIDPFGNVLDYSAKLYRNFNRTWNFSGLHIKTKVVDYGYVVEGTIPLKELKKLVVLNKFYLGVFRADFKSHDIDNVYWNSWVKPKSPTPDFHIPSAFALASMSKN